MWHAAASSQEPESKQFSIQGKFKELFLEGVFQTLESWFIDGDESIDEDEEGLSYVQHSPPFEKFTNREKLWAVAEVTRSLTNKKKAPELLQWNESTVYAIFETIAAEISVEIDTERHDSIEEEYRFYWRKLASEAQREIREYDEEEYIDHTCNNTKEWEQVILDDLAGIILWDDDFLEYESNNISDKSPERAEMLKYMMGIADNYYSEPMPLITDKMMDSAKKFLKKTFKPKPAP